MNKRHERAWNILGVALAVILVGYLLWSATMMVGDAAW